MKILGLAGVLVAFGVVIALDWPKLKEAENIKKFKAVYFSVIAAGLLVSVLEMFDLIPRFDVMIVDFYKKLFGPQK